MRYSQYSLEIILYESINLLTADTILALELLSVSETTETLVYLSLPNLSLTISAFSSIPGYQRTLYVQYLKGEEIGEIYQMRQTLVHPSIHLSMIHLYQNVLVLQ
jgi:hypothetical protein